MTMVYDDLGDGTTSDVPVRRIKFTINGEKKIAEVEPRLLLAHLIRRGLGLTGTHMGCDTTNCGACTVLVDGRPVKSCMMLAAKALLEENPDPSEEDVRWALSGNLCRCTGYQNIVKSVLWAAAKLKAESASSAES